MHRPGVPFGPEALLRHREWIERVAHALVLGDADAEDLAQQVWMEMLSRPPQKVPGRLRAWLRSVLRFKAIDNWRSTEARRRAEALAARGEAACADPADVVARAETLDRVAHAVLALPEPYRTTVLLRWFEDMTPRRIAAQQGVPVETVRTRLKRALVQLRERMDAQSDGDRRAWCLALLPLLQRRAATAGAGTLTAWVAVGALIMKTKVAIACAVLVLLACGILVWEGSRDRAAFVERARGQSMPSPTRIDAARVTSPLSPLAPATGGKVTVHVESLDAEPVAGARVDVGPARDGAHATWCAEPVFASGTSDASGRVTIDLSTRELAYVREIRVSRSGYVAASHRGNDDDVTIRLRPAAVLHGRVYDAETGHGLPGVPVVVERIRVRPPGVNAATVSGADGRFELTTLAPDYYTLRARSPEWLDNDVPYIKLSAGEARSIEIGLRRGLQLAGVVKSAQTGAPIETGRVIFRVPALSGGSKTTQLGAGGSFTLRGLAKGTISFAHQSLQLEAGGFEDRLALVTAPAFDLAGSQTRLAVLEAQPATSFTGRVLDVDGNGVAGARVAIGCLDLLDALQDLDVLGDDAAHRTSRAKEAVTASDGTFSMGAGSLHHAQGNLATERRLLVVHPGFGVYYRAVSMDEILRPLEVHLQPGVRLDIDVVDTAGRGESGAQIQVELRDPLDLPGTGPYHGDPFAALWGAIVCDEQGHGSLDHLGAGEWMVRVRSADERRWATNIVRLGAEGPFACRVVLSDAPAVTGRVVDDESSEPLAGVVVALDGGISNRLREAVSDTSGCFAFRCVEPDAGAPAGLTLVVREIPGPALWLPMAGQRVHAGDEVVLRARCWVRETREISGRVLDAVTGASVQRGLIKCSWLDPRDTNATQGGMDGWFSDGVFSRQVPVVDRLRLTFWAEDYEKQVVGLDDLEQAAFEVRLVPKAPTSKYGLRVRAIGGEHPSGAVPQTAWIYVYDPDTKRQRGRWLTGTLPEFVLSESDLGTPSPGLLELQVAGWYQADPVEFDIDPGHETAVTIRLIKGGATLGGTCDAKAGSKIELTYPVGLKRLLVVGENGKWWAGVLAPGTYSLALNDAEPVSVSLADGQRAEIDVRGPGPR